MQVFCRQLNEICLLCFVVIVSKIYGPLLLRTSIGYDTFWFSSDFGLKKLIEFITYNTFS